MRKHQQILMAAALTLILLGLAYWAGRDQPSPATRKVVMVSRHVSAGDRLTSDDLKLVDLPEEVYQDHYLTDLAAAIGWWTGQPLESGEILLSGKLTQSPAGIHYPNPGPGRRLLTIELAPGAANGFYLAPGNRIDLILVPRQSSEGLEPTQTISGILVIDVMGAKQESSGIMPAASPSSALLCLDVSDLQARKIAEAKSQADIQIAVVNEPVNAT